MSKNTDKIEVTAAEFRDLAARLADEKTAAESKATDETANERERLRIERERLALEREKIRAEYERERLEAAQRKNDENADDLENRRARSAAAFVFNFLICAGLAAVSLIMYAIVAH